MSESKQTPNAGEQFDASAPAKKPVDREELFRIVAMLNANVKPGNKITHFCVMGDHIGDGVIII